MSTADFMSSKNIESSFGSNNLKKFATTEFLVHIIIIQKNAPTNTIPKKNVCKAVICIS